MFSMKPALYPSPRKPCRHKSVWPLIRTAPWSSGDCSRLFMLSSIEHHYILEASTIPATADATEIGITHDDA